MEITYCYLNYWKIVELITLNNDHLRTPHLVRSKKVAIHYHDNLFHACCSFYHSCCNYNWEITTHTFSEATLDDYRFYHLTGHLDISDYTSVEEEIDFVDQIVLAPSPDHVLINAGYWPEYNQAGNRQWHWLGQPRIEEAGKVAVFDWYLKGLFGGVSIIFDEMMLDINDVRLEGFR